MVWGPRETHLGFCHLEFLPLLYLHAKHQLCTFLPSTYHLDLFRFLGHVFYLNPLADIAIRVPPHIPGWCTRLMLLFLCLTSLQKAILYRPHGL